MITVSHVLHRVAGFGHDSITVSLLGENAGINSDTLYGHELIIEKNDLVVGTYDRVAQIDASGCMHVNTEIVVRVL